MDLKQLEYFAAIVEEGSITGAARRLHMAQPPLSHMLKGLEEELGTTLLGRGARRVTLTQSGEVLQLKAAGVLRRHCRGGQYHRGRPASAYGTASPEPYAQGTGRGIRHYPAGAGRPQSDPDPVRRSTPA